jgi:hypothetical protein
MKTSGIFISHSARDRHLAKVLKDYLCHTLPLDSENAFVSSLDSLPANSDFPIRIRRALISSAAVIALLTPNSMKSPWVHFEAGGAYFRQEECLFLAIASGLRVESDLPTNLIHRQATTLSDPMGVSRLVRDLRSILKLPDYAKKRSKTKPLLQKLIATAAGEWHPVLDAQVSVSASSSPFGLKVALETAQRLVFASGQNGYALVGKCGADDTAVFKFLQKPGSRLQLLLVDPRSRNFFEIWPTIVMNGFEPDYERSWAVMQRWLTKAESLGINRGKRRRLDIRLSSIVNGNVVFRDPTTPAGTMSMTSVLFRQPLAENRPVWHISGGIDNPVLRHYWDSYHLQFDQSTPIVRGIAYREYVNKRTEP